jgi:hypothetical protein
MANKVADVTPQAVKKPRTARVAALQGVDGGGGGGGTGTRPPTGQLYPRGSGAGNT